VEDPSNSEETMAFSKLAGVKARIEIFPLNLSAPKKEVFGMVIKNKVRFRAVLVP
jgi:hypothetical protein